MSDHRKYRVEYKLTRRFGAWQHSYLVVGRWGAVHLHIDDHGEEKRESMGQRYFGGLEVHYRQPPDYMADQPPSHERCWAFDHGSPCWHDGTSLYVEEVLLPLWESRQNDHEFMFERLKDELHSRLEPASQGGE